MHRDVEVSDCLGIGELTQRGRVREEGGRARLGVQEKVRLRRRLEGGQRL